MKILHPKLRLSDYLVEYPANYRGKVSDKKPATDVRNVGFADAYNSNSPITLGVGAIFHNGSGYKIEPRR